MKEKIWLSSPHMGGREQDFVNEAFATNWIAPLGPHVNGFEQDLENYLQNKVHVAALSSGTAALHLALVALDIKPEDTVLCQSMTFSASANPIAYLGAKPIFIDSEKTTWNLNPELLEEAIIAEIKLGKKPKAIIVVHLYGMPAQMKQINEIGVKYDIPIIEDAAEALGSTYHEQTCGTLGDFGILSFNGNKIITTSGGGALVCNTKSEKEKTVFLATQARDQAPHYQHSTIGYNYRMSNVVAGIGRGQMQVLSDRVNKRRSIFDFYQKELSSLPIQFLQEPAGSISNRWLTTILTDSYAVREKIRQTLETDNIESRPLWKPMHLQPVFNDAKAYVNGVSEEFFDKGLCLPSGSNMTSQDLERVVTQIKSCF